MTLYARVKHEGAESFATVDGDQLHLLSGDIFGEHSKTGEVFPLQSAALLAPVRPPKILAAAVNYPSHVPSPGLCWTARRKRRPSRSCSSSHPRR
jgi:hypothetical protein